MKMLLRAHLIAYSYALAGRHPRPQYSSAGRYGWASLGSAYHAMGLGSNNWGRAQ